MTLTVNCPTCQRPVIWDAAQSPFRPFCSDRCRLIDLGEWADESHRIASDEPFDDLEGLSDEQLAEVARRLFNPAADSDRG